MEEPERPAIRIFVDADACPVKPEVYRVAERYGLKVFVVANAFMNVPRSDMIERVIVSTKARTWPTTGSPSAPARATSSSPPTFRWPAAA